MTDMRLSKTDRLVKRSLDVVLAAAGLSVTWWIILLAYLAASHDTGQSGLFIQERVGLNGELFKLKKIRTMRHIEGINTSVTTRHDPRITRFGALLRKYKIDELPQLFNVLIGDMSFVGPRPDVPGFADLLHGEDRAILSIRPGITGPATLKYRNEEQLLANQDDPDRFNREVIYTDKVAINKQYLREYSLWRDLSYIIKTVLH